CIGCTLCIDACPVDAIVGAAKRMHTVLAAHCTGCELCVPLSPVACIAIVPAGRKWGREDALVAATRYHASNARRGADPVAVAVPVPIDGDRAKRRAAVDAALARARRRRARAGSVAK